MKKVLLFILLPLMVSLSCKDDDDAIQYRLQTVATPVLIDKADLRASYKEIKSETPRTIEFSGKFYAYKDYIFINDRGLGIHILDNSNPSAPQKLSFLEIPGSFDMEVRDDILYVDSYTDLVLFDLSDINTITYLKTFKDILGSYYDMPQFTQQVDYVDYNTINLSQKVVVGWEYSREMRAVQNFTTDSFFDGALNSSGGAAGENTGQVAGGQGGSFARFNIVGDRLYIINEGQLFTFDVSSREDPVIVNTQQLSNWNMETIFHQGDYLYMGSDSGMHIYDITNRDNPEWVSAIEHVVGCDPVVVDGDYAYVTVRGGNACGQDLSFLEVIDVSDKKNPGIIEQYDMMQPYGLGIHGNKLFVSDGEYGLHIYDRTDPTDLKLVKNKENLTIYDVIPLNDKLLMIGDNILHQYEYSGMNINEISTFQMN